MIWNMTPHVLNLRRQLISGQKWVNAFATHMEQLEVS